MLIISGYSLGDLYAIIAHSLIPAPRYAVTLRYVIAQHSSRALSSHQSLSRFNSLIHHHYLVIIVVFQPRCRNFDKHITWTQTL